MARFHGLKILGIVIILSGCGYFKRTPEAKPKPSTKVEQLQTDMALWMAALKAGADQVTGWPSGYDCDGTLWAGLGVVGGDTDIQINLAETPSGETIRSPLNPCTPTSRDMVLGYAYAKFVQKDLAALQRLANFGEANDWYMSANHERSSIDQVSRAVLARAIDALSHGADKRFYEHTPLACISLPKDFEQHLQTVLALLGGEVDVALNQSALVDLPQGCVDVLKGFANGNPKDALFAAAVGVYTGDFDPAFNLILDSGYVCPTYVRGSPNYCFVHKLLVARTILSRYGK